jgi:hypothetical protein
VRGTVDVFGGVTPSNGSITSSSVEMLSGEQGAFVNLPSLSCGGGIRLASAIAVDESDSAEGQVILLGGVDEHEAVQSVVHLVDLATGACTRQPDMLHARFHSAAARLKDGRVVCAGSGRPASRISAEVYGPPAQGAPDAPWTWTELPAMSVGRHGCSGCVMRDGRFAVLGGVSSGGSTSLCEALVVGDDAHWEPLTPMHESRDLFVCAAVAGCVIVAGGYDKNQPKSTTRCWIGGFGFRVTYLTSVMGWRGWVARFCSQI